MTDATASSAGPGSADLLQRARDWATQDPDPVTSAELERLVEAGATDELADRFSGTLEFGTAGLRGALGAGPNRMNRVVVLRAAAGLAAYLLDEGASPGDSVVIGYDARHNSDVFARDTAEVMTGAGLHGPRAPAPTADTAARVRHPRPRLCGRGDGDGQPQPAAGQRLQGLPRRRQPDRAPGRRRDRRARSLPSARSADIPRGAGGEVLGDDLLDRYLDVRGRPRGHRATRPRRRLHPAARRRRQPPSSPRFAAGRLRRAARRHGPGRARP